MKKTSAPANSVKFETDAISAARTPRLNQYLMEAILLFERNEEGPENTKMHGDEIYSLQSQRARLLLPAVVNGEAFPVTAVCHTAGRAGIAPIPPSQLLGSRAGILPSLCHPPLQLGKGTERRVKDECLASDSESERRFSKLATFPAVT